MKILYLLRYYPTLSETFVLEELRGLAGRVELAVAALGERADGVLQEDLPDLPVLRVPRRPLAGRLAPPSRGQRWLDAHPRPKDVARLPWLARRAAAYDHIHVHFAGEAAEWAHALWLDLGLPYTVMVHAVDLFKPRPSFADVLAHATEVLTVADHHVALLVARGISARRVRCGPDLDRWQPTPLPPGPLRVCFVGRDVPKKGLDTLLSAWPYAPQDAHLDLIGPTRPGPARVRAWGPQPPRVVRETLQQAHLLVLPCRVAPDGDQDGVPLVLMEAMALGRPVLSTPISGIGELVDETTGWLVPPDDPVALARILHTPLPELARRGAHGPDRLRKEQFTRADQLDGVLAAWERSAHR